MKIGFIGLGIMGKPMAKNLLKAGHELTVFDLNKAAVDELVKAGAKAAGSNAGLASGVELVITMLPNSPQVKAAVCGEKGVLEGAKAGLIIVDMTSGDFNDSKDIEKACSAKGVKFIDAPVSGGEPGAIAGTIAIMVGGDKAVFEQVKPVLLKMGSSATWCGPIGAGNLTKLANQIIVGVNIAGMVEAFTLAKRAGVDPKLVYEAIKGGLAGSHVMDQKMGKILDSDFKPGFKIDLHIKDLNNALNAGHACGAPLPFTALVREMMGTLHADGCGNDDHSALAKVYAKVSGTKIGK
jgi:2-hydroxy-3-oxopropionate reductase